jgi:hypothetical protein
MLLRKCKNTKIKHIIDLVIKCFDYFLEGGDSNLQVPMQKRFSLFKKKMDQIKVHIF